MSYRKPLAATLAALLCCVVPLPAQQPQDPTDINYSLSNGAFWNLGIYQPRDIPPADLTDSTRLGHLIRGGKLYLSLADAIALTLENNLDIAVGRYSPLEAAADLLRAKAGSNLSGVQTQISTLSTGQSVQGGGSQFVSGPSGQASRVTQGASQAAQSAVGGGAGNAASFFGTQTINLDPQVTYSHTFFRTSNPQIQSIFTGTNTLINDGRTANWSYQQGFVTGTTVNVGMTTFRQKNNNVFNSFNPTLTVVPVTNPCW